MRNSSAAVARSFEPWLNNDQPSTQNRAPIAVGPQARQPFVDQRRLARAALGDEREDIGLFVAPCLVEALELRVASDQPLVAGLRQAADVD